MASLALLKLIGQNIKKKYLHFDKCVDIKNNEHMQAKIQDPTWVASYAFCRLFIL